jgi:hypothetical protein
VLVVDACVQVRRGERLPAELFEGLGVGPLRRQEKLDGVRAVGLYVPAGVDGPRAAAGEQPVEAILLGDEARAGAAADERGPVVGAGVESILVTMLAQGA